MKTFFSLTKTHQLNANFRRFLMIWRHNAQHNDIEHNDTQHNDIEHNDTQHNNKLNATFSIMTRRIMQSFVMMGVSYAQCYLWWVSHASL
jgi:hypothetical protein